jgi:hypothetical protein
MKPLSILTTLEEEIQHIADFIQQKWEPIADLPMLLAKIKDHAAHDGRGWINKNHLAGTASMMLERRIALLNQRSDFKAGPPVEFYDDPCLFLYELQMASLHLHEAGLELDGSWEPDERAAEITRTLLIDHPYLEQARPKGWLELAKGYTDFKGRDEYDPRADQELFKGSDTQKLNPFTNSVALPNVMHNERYNGRNPLTTLVSAIYVHCLEVTGYLNLLQLQRDLIAALPHVNQPTLVFERNITTHNPFLQVVLLMTPAFNPKESDYIRAKNTEPLSPEAIAQSEAATQKAGLEAVARRNPVDIKAKNAIREASFHSFLKAAFVQQYKLQSKDKHIKLEETSNPSP